MTDEQDLDTRLTNLERFVIKTVGKEEERLTMPVHPAAILALGIAAIALGYLGLGIPQHYYQPIFAGLLLALIYHRHLIHHNEQPWRWPIVVMNFLVLCLLMKFLIGGGVTHPFSWLQVPSLSEVDTGQQGWRKLIIPQLELKWKAVDGITHMKVDITRIQSLFLIFTLAASLMRFQVFASMTAMLLLLISIPTLFLFNWQWVIWFLVATTVSFYLQTYKSDPPADSESETKSVN